MKLRTNNIRIWILLICLVAAPDSADAQTLTQQLTAEPVTKLAGDARRNGSAVRGAILFAQQKLGCVNCHASGNDALLGPDLTRSGDDLNDEQLVESLLAPSKRIKKGFETVTIATVSGKSLTGRILEHTDDRIVLRDTSALRQRITIERTDIEQMVTNTVSGMPDRLADQLQNRQQFLDLVRYVIEISSTGSRPTIRSQGGGSVSAELQGLILIRDLNCAACHQDDASPTQLSAKRAPDLAWSDGRISPAYLQRYLAAPSEVKPGTTMPDVMSSLKAADRQKVAQQLTHYLASLTDRNFAAQPVDAESAARGRELFHTVGCVACHSPRNDQGQETLAQTSVPLGRVEDKYNAEGLAAFLESPHAVRPSGRMPGMNLTHWEALDIAHYLSSRTATIAAPAAPFEVDHTLATAGKAEFNRLGCVQCHRDPQKSAPAISQPLSAVRVDRGCLSAEHGSWPQFSLTAAQREAIRTALSQGQRTLTDEEQIGVTLTAFRCVNCHQRKDLGGVSAERNPHFHTTDPNLGPQGRIPPTLTGVGAKLNPAWLRQVLVGGRTIRPYVLSRMPKFGTENVEHLIDLLGRVDELPDIQFTEFADQKPMREAGFEMVGNRGLNCIACHTFQLKGAATMPAVDLTDMAERLQKKWFYHYMRNPQQLSLNTVMPSFWPGGRAIRQDLLGGDADLQIEALWQYLLDGRQARQPRGLIIEPIELLATDEAVMLRRSYPGVGKRGIGVGYPEQVNLVFDAEQMRLAMLWAGKFADPGGVWRSQGHGTVRPLSRNVIQFAAGPDLDDAEAPWIVDEGRPPQHRFRGYSLDERQRPRLMYDFDEVRVVDYFVDTRDAERDQPYLRRTVTFSSDRKRPGCAFRIANGRKIVSAGDTEFIIDDTLRIRVSDRSAEIRKATTGDILHVPLNIPAGTSTLMIEYRW
ncbi:MAG: c-type cytochrome [Fuerstiella sp.]